jgi:Concanavalin A-like lectin/glucanases superfamily
VGTTRIRAVVGLTMAFLLLTGNALGSLSNYRKAIVRSDPVAFWRLNERSGTIAYPRVGRRYTGRYHGRPRLRRRGLIRTSRNKAPHFDGRDDRVTANDLTSRSKSSWSKGYTLEAWVKTNTTSVEEHILAFNTNNGGNSIAIFRDEPTNRFKFRDCEGSGCVSVYSKTKPVIGKIYQVVATVNASNRGHLYVNGRRQASFVSRKRPPHSAKFTIGAEYDCCPKPTSFWHGKIDEVAVYNRALSARRVARQWALGTG